MIYLSPRMLHALMLIFCLVSFATFLLRDPSFLLSPLQNIINRPCGCRPCIWAPEEEDTWFGERFNQSFHPLLSRSNSELNDDTYRWWLVSTLSCVYSFIVVDQPRHVWGVKFVSLVSCKRFEINIHYMAE